MNVENNFLRPLLFCFLEDFERLKTSRFLAYSNSLEFNDVVKISQPIVLCVMS